MPTRPSDKLEAIDNPNPDRAYVVRLECSELTCLCPRTGQPDFATIRIRYVPGPHIVELKSLKLYLWSYRDVGIFHEALVNEIRDDLVLALSPHALVVEGEFAIRGGIRTVVESSYPDPVRALARTRPVPLTPLGGEAATASASGPRRRSR